MYSAVRGGGSVDFVHSLLLTVCTVNTINIENLLLVAGAIE
jgi:hypothetical protein